MGKYLIAVDIRRAGHCFGHYLFLYELTLSKIKEFTHSRS